jgi:group I intron endonuclease
MIRTSGIYAIVNEANSKFYIGSAVDLGKRWSCHLWRLRQGNHFNLHLQNAWNFYGEEFFEFVILVECPVEKLVEAEQDLIDYSIERWGYEKLYNINPKAVSSIGRHASTETRAKISESGKGKKRSSKFSKKISESMKGNKNSLGKKNALGYRHTEKAKQAISEAKRGKPRGRYH